MSGITHSLEEDQEESIKARSADQREEELGMFWSYILGMLINLESLPLAGAEAFPGQQSQAAQASILWWPLQSTQVNEDEYYHSYVLELF